MPRGIKIVKERTDGGSWPEALGDLAGRVCVVGIGHVLRGDDGAGPAVVTRLVPGPDRLCIDAGAAPENYAEAIARFRPDHVVLIDAADFGGAPGDVRLLPASDFGASGISCHASSLNLLARYLAARCPCRIHLLAIQPGATTFAAPLSPPVEEAVRRCIEALQSALRHA
jgi:hydrogenase 3 maturation protease